MYGLEGGTVMWLQHAILRNFLSGKQFVTTDTLNHCGLVTPWGGMPRSTLVLVIQCKPDISRSCISRNWIYRGCMLDPIFFGPPISRILQTQRPRAWYFSRNRGNSLHSIAGDNFSWNLLTAIAFVPVCWRQFFAKSTQAYLSMRAGTHAVRWAATLGGALTPPLCHRAGSS